MLKSILKTGRLSYTRLCRSYVSSNLEKYDEKKSLKDVTVPEESIEIPKENQSVLESNTEDISHVSTYLKPSFNFASYVNKSETLQELLKLGVNLHKLEKIDPSFVLSLDFERDVKDKVKCLHDLGLELSAIANLITKNPYIFKESIEDIIVRINYLKSKRFTDDGILRIIEKNPYWLSYTTKDIDTKLGFFQRQFNLNGNEVRQITVQKPTLITYNIKKVKLNHFAIKEEMGFENDEIKKILLKKPSIFLKHQDNVLKTFDYLHNTMKISLDKIVEFPDILTCRVTRLKARHLFLEKLGRAQYNPKEPMYVALKSLVSGDDSSFSTEVAKSSVQAYNTYLKSL